MGTDPQFVKPVTGPRPRVERACRPLAARVATVAALALTLATPALATPSPAPAAADEPARYLPASFFQERVSGDAALDPESDELVKELRNMAFGVDPQTDFNCRSAVLKGSPSTWTAEEEANCQRVTTRAGIARDDYAPVVYTVPGDQPRVPITLDNYNPSLKRALADGVPLPDGAEPASGTDGQLIVWQPATDTMWEFWRPYKDSAGAWHTSWGGRMQEVSENPGHFQSTPDPSARELPSAKRAQLGLNSEEHRWGGPATSIPNLPGIMTVDQLRSGEIGHALVFATWAAKPDEWVYPAQRTDGICRGPAGQYCSQIPAGARFRLDPDFDTDTISHPLVRMMAEAVQDYGMVLNNKTGGGANFYAEGWRQHGWEDPYYGPGGLFASDPEQRSPTQFMREFPWEQLQMLERGTACTDRSSECEAPGGWLESNGSSPPSSEEAPSDPPAPSSGGSSGSSPPPARDVSPAASPPQLRHSRLRLTRVSTSNSHLRVRGRLDPQAPGKIKVLSRLRFDGRGERRARIAAPSSGRLDTRLRLPGSFGRSVRGSVVAEYRGGPGYDSARERLRFR